MPNRLGNFFIKALVNSPLHPVLGKSFAVVTVTGRKSGRPISTPINTVIVDDLLTVISLRKRTWWRNLRNGRTAQLRRAGERIPVQAEVIESPEEIISIMTKYFSQNPGYAKYFEVHAGPDGRLDPGQLDQLGQQRVIIRLHPA
jgi:deazaflavin-dependent oxidoreductase (nitroreductase family)